MPNPSKTAKILRVSEISQQKATFFALRPDTARCLEIAKELGLSGLRKLSFSGRIDAAGKSDWHLKAKLGASVTQPCVVTLAPVVTRIDAPVVRHFLSVMPSSETDAELGEEVEMPDDESIEPLGKEIDLESIMIEALALSLPTYPRSGDAALQQSNFTEPGRTAMEDGDALPFASLSALRDAMKDDPADDS